MELDQEQGVDVAKEPVDLDGKTEFMDTGVLHEGRLCVTCAERPAAKGKSTCVECGDA